MPQAIDDRRSGHVQVAAPCAIAHRSIGLPPVPSATGEADPVAGVAHDLAGVDHSRSNVVRAAAIDLPVADRCICRVELTITYDMFTWATHGKPPLIGYRVRLERGHADDPIRFDTAGLGPPPQGPIVTGVGTVGAPPAGWSGQHYLGQPDGNSVSETRTINQSVEIVVTDRIRLSTFAVAWGGADGVDAKHSGGGVRVIATIAKIHLLPPGSFML